VEGGENMSGYKDFGKLMKDLEKNIKKEVDGEYTSSEMFNDSFMQTNTRFSSFEEFTTKSPYNWEEHTGHIQEIDDKELDDFIDEFTDFPNWDGMLSTAAHQAAEKRLKKLFK
jgi:hypothetical protein